MTSKWVRMVAAQRDYTVDWRFISLRLINSAIDYGSHFPVGYEEGHTSGLRLLRVAARTRAEHGPAAVGPFYVAVSGEIFDSPDAASLTAATRGSREFTAGLLTSAGLPPATEDRDGAAARQGVTRPDAASDRCKPLIIAARRSLSHADRTPRPRF
jgi:hypothetical protein